MKMATGDTPAASRLRFLQESCIRTTAAALSEAAWTMAKGNIGIKAVARTGRCTIGWKISLNDQEMPDDTDWPDVTVRQMTFDGNVETVTTSFPKALSTLMREAIEVGYPNWRSVAKSLNFRLRIAGDDATVHWTEGKGAGAFAGKMTFTPDPSDLFMKKKSIAETVSGAWYEIETAKEGEAATALSQTAIGHYYVGKRESSPARWFVHIELDGDVPVAGISLVAQSTKGFDPSAWPHFSHVTGRHNADVYLEREQEIRALARTASLVVEPNWMGKALSPATESVQAEGEPAGRILRTQIDHGWTTETLEMLSRRFIEANGLSAEYAGFLEEQAAFENGEGPEDEDGPGL